MGAYFVRRLILVPITFLAITFMVYAILRIVPGGPVEQAEMEMRLGSRAAEAGGGASAQAQVSAEQLKELQRFYSLDRPIPIGYLQWLGLWPRDVHHPIPTPPRESHPEAFAALTAAENEVELASEAVLDAARDEGLVLLEGRLWRRLPDEEVPEDVRKRANLLVARTFGERFEVEEYLAPHSLAHDGQSFLAPVEPAAGVADAHKRLKDALAAQEEVEKRTGYVLEEGNLLQRPLKALYRLKQVELDAERRIEDHLATKGFIEARSLVHRPLIEAERKQDEEFFKEMDKLRAKGYSKLDELVAELAEKGFAHRGDQYYRVLPETEQADEPQFFETARILIEARDKAARKLAAIEARERIVATDDLRAERVETGFNGIFQFNFGNSYRYTEPVLGLIGSRMGISLQFGLIGYLLTWIVCIPLGVTKAIRHKTMFDTGSSVLVFLGYAIPGFVLALLLLSTVAVHVDWLPLGGYKPPNIDELGWWDSVVGRFRYMLIPVSAYVIGGFATMTILMKNSLLDNLSQDYVRTAFAKGLTERRVIFVHALRNSLIPVTAGIGHALGLLFAGSFLIEKVCNIPGMGLLGYEAIISRDYPIILGLLVFLVLIQLFGNIISDLIWALIDPRIRFGAA